MPLKLRVLSTLFTAGIACSAATLHADEQQSTADGVRSRPAVSDQQVVVQAELIEVSRGKMRKLGIDFHDLGSLGLERRAAQDLPSPSGVVGLCVQNPHRSAVWAGLLDALCENGVAKRLAAPTILTADGATATLSVGGKAAPSDKTPEVFVGTKLQVTPTLLDGSRIRLNLHLKCSELASGTEPDSPTGWRLLCREVDTTVVGTLGERCFIAGAASPPADPAQGEATTLVLAVKPTLMDAPKSASSRSALKGPGRHRR